METINIKLGSEWFSKICCRQTD